MGLYNPMAVEVNPRWLEIGSGDSPTPGYIHLDINNGAPHLEIHADALSIPFPDQSMDRILSIHLIEHFNQFDLIPLLREWYRVLAPGGELIIHTPDFAILSTQYVLCQDMSKKMRIALCILGVDGFGLHRSLLDYSMLAGCMGVAGFEGMKEVEGMDRHEDGWRDVLDPSWSLKVSARRPF